MKFIKTVLIFIQFHPHHLHRKFEKTICKVNVKCCERLIHTYICHMRVQNFFSKTNKKWKLKLIKVVSNKSSSHQIEQNNNIPILFIPFSRSSFPFKEKSPKYVGAKHLMKSSSTPPAVVTIQSTYLKIHIRTFHPNSQQLFFMLTML